MFWAKEEEENSLVQLLKTPNFTLTDVLLNEFVVQESRYGRATLTAFFTKRENMSELLRLSLYPTVDESIPMKQQYRLSFIASEILTSRGSDLYQQMIVTEEDTRSVLISFLNSEEPLNHLVAGFFAKIMECLLSKQFGLTFSILRESRFFDKCLQNISLGAMECLMENIVRIPSSSVDTNTIKQWMIEDNLFGKIVDRLSENSTDDDNECLSEVYCEIIRELRDKLYVVDNKEDHLHDKVMDEELIAKIADKMVVDENADYDVISKRSGMIKAATKIMESFIRSNFVLNAPSHQLDEEAKQELDERHNASNTNMRMVESHDDNDSQIFQPDPERLVEGIVANRALNLFQTLCRDIENNGVVWQPILRLIVELCNTNYMPTHLKLADAFRRLPFIKIVEVAKKLPKASILHSLIEKVISYTLYTKFPLDKGVLSPAAEYLLKEESGLIRSIHETAFAFQETDDLIASSGLRTFNMNLAHAIHKARTLATTAESISKILKSEPLWEELEETTMDYDSTHRPSSTPDFPNDSVITSNPGFESDDRDFLNDSEEWSSDGASKLALFEKEAGLRSSSAPATSSDTDQFNFNLDRFSDLDSSQFDDTPDEDEFKKLCSQRANSSSCSFNEPPGSQSFNSSTDTVGWPGVSQNTSKNDKKEEKADDWVWPVTPPVGEKEAKVFASSSAASSTSNPDAWADFSSFSGETSSSGSSSNTKDVQWPQWPDADRQNPGVNADWPLNNSNDSRPTDPVTIGLASGISHHNDDENDKKNCSEA